MLKKLSARAVWLGDKQFYLEPFGRAGSTGRPKEKPLSKAQDFFLKILSEQGEIPLSVLIAAVQEGGICTPDTAVKVGPSLAWLGEFGRIDGGGRGVPAVYDQLEGQAEVLRE
ncbi:MAG TPA: hypothetical protein VMJ64_01540 [Anaerolineales bacterium]|nr:hypothetical protein [Anaerolineales bacterium]